MKYIIDGYNLLKHPLFNSYLKEDPILTVKSIVPFLMKELGHNFVIVFDGKFDIPPDFVGFVKVSGTAQDADTYIVNLLLKKGADNKIVVTNDVHLSMRVKSVGSSVISIEEFFQIIKKKERKSYHKKVRKDGLSKKEMDDINKELKDLWGIE